MQRIIASDAQLQVHGTTGSCRMVWDMSDMQGDS